MIKIGLKSAKGGISMPEYAERKVSA